MAKTLVTGAHGFIGSHLVKALKERGDEVMTISHTSFRDPVSLQIIESLKDIDYIFHLAAYGNMAHQTDEGQIFKANIDGLWNLLQATKLIPYKAFVNVSTSSVLLPHQTIYSSTKKAGEALCQAFQDEYWKPILSFRPYSVYGQGEADYRFIPTVFRSCLKGEEMQLAEGAHDWVYIDDVVEDLLDIAEGVALGELFDTFDCGTGISTTNTDVVKLIEMITGKKANITKQRKLRSFDTDNWKAEEISHTHIQLKEGLQLYYESSKTD